MSMTNGGPPPEGAASAPDQAAPSLNVLAQYVKDLSFENPNAPRSLSQQPGQQQPGQQAPKISIQINVNAKPLGETEFEVELKIEGRAELPTTFLFGFDLLYAGIFRIQNVPQENVHALIMIECPRLLFPFARAIIANAVRNGGFPPLMIDPVDFVSLYRQRLSQKAPANPPPRARLGPSRKIILPDRLFTERRHERAVRLAFGIGDARQKRRRAHADRR